MSIAFSQAKTVYENDVPRNTSLALRGALDDILKSVGWSVDRDVTNGKVYIFQSPQLLLAKCKIQDTGGSAGGISYLDITFMDDDETHTGFSHSLTYGDTGTILHYQINCGKCQVFISAPGQSTKTDVSKRLTHVSGGIPFIPDNVTISCVVADAPDISKLWWSSGSKQTGAPNFRRSRINEFGYSCQLNGEVFVNSTNESYGQSPLVLVPLTPTENVDSIFHTPQPTRKYGSLDPLLIDAFLGFRWQMRGQLWDALIKTAPAALESEFTTLEPSSLGGDVLCTWIAHNYEEPSHIDGAGTGTFYSTLYLLKNFEPPAPAGNNNYAY